VTFRCKNDGGQPLHGVFIDVHRRGGAPLGSVQSDAQGLARLGRLAAGDTIEGVARHPLSRETVAFGPITIRTGSVVDLSFRRADTGTLEGKIVDDRGQAVADASLQLVDPRQSGQSNLDGLAMGLGPDGTFLATVAAGNYAVSATAPGFSPSDRAYVTVPAGGDAGPVNLVLQRQGTISGKLQLPPDLQSVLPISLDLVLEVTSGSEQNPYQRVDRRPLQVDASLRFTVDGCDPGRYRLRLEVPEAGGNRVGPWYAFTMSSGQQIDGVQLVLTETPVAVRGVVRDDQGDPIEGASVSVQGREATTDRDGRYALRGIDQGEDILVEASCDGHAPTTQQTTYAGSELSIDLVLPRNGGLRGVVKDSKGPAAGVTLIACLRSDLGVRPFQVSTGNDGGYLLEDLPPGSYYLKAGPGANPFDATGAPTVDVRAGEVTDAPPVTIP
jgi:hypothetical protein